MSNSNSNYDFTQSPIYLAKKNGSFPLVSISPTYNLSYPMTVSTTFTYDYRTGKTVPVNSDDARNKISGGDYPPYVNPR